MKRTALKALEYLLKIIAIIFVIPDRFIQAFNPYRDIPGIKEINEFDHEKQALAERWVIYTIVSIILLLVEWLTSGVSSLFHLIW